MGRVQPFRQLPFEHLPDAPRVPHPFGRATRHDRELDTESFGRVRVAWREYGAGEPLLLVHGLMTAGYSWRYVLEPLGARYRLVIPDLPGSGDSAMPDRSYHPDRLAEFVGEFTTALGIRGCRAIGNSLGGYLCLRLALRDPGALGRLVDLHSPGVPLLRLRALRLALSLPGSHALLRVLVHRDPERWVHRNVHYWDETLKSREETRTWAAPLRSAEGVRAFGRVLYETLDPSEMAAFVGTLAARRDRGEPFPVPLLLVYASSDPMVPPWVGDRLRELLPDAGFVRLERGSHFAHVDAVDAFVAAVAGFLSGAAPPRP